MTESTDSAPTPKLVAASKVYPHDPIKEIQSDVFLVRGSIQMNPLVRITRNMVIVRHEGDLTLIDPIRLSSAEEEALKALGTVKQVLRLGPMHSVDDAYYMDKYDAPLWGPGPAALHPLPKPTVALDATSELPFPDAELFCFQGTKQPEAALLLKRGKGLLITCDAIQNYGDYRHNNWLARRALPFIGFPKSTLVGPIWVKLMTPKGGDLESEFRRLLQLDFDQLISAHGSLLASGAKAACQRAVDKVFTT
ncbi:MAG: hypothetical protein AB8G23_15890 [Myxococcota bacterium]